MAITKFTIPAASGRKSFDIYAEPANLNYFLKTALTPAEAAGVSNKSVVGKASMVRQYPGDPSAYNRPQVTRRVLIDPTRKSGNGLPGRSITLVSEPNTAREERRSFTLRGQWIDFHAWFSLEAKYKSFAFNNNGTRYSFDAAPAAP
jgi:hypothetical protein